MEAKLMEFPDPENDIHLFRIFDSGISPDPLDEIVHLVKLIAPSADKKLIINSHRDIQDIFSGYFPGFRQNMNKYHDLRHTYAVALATARLFHGTLIQGQTFSNLAILKGMLSAYFHDTGLLLRSFDTAENGAEYTRYHETRSIDVLENYLKSWNLDDEIRVDCSSIIRCTNIEFDFESTEFSSPEIKRVAQIVGTADLLAQMADRYYLEQLPHLYQERKAGGVLDHLSAFELMRETTSFYHNVIMKRLETVLGDAAHAMKDHFRQRWNLNRDLYKENIKANIDYLQKVVDRCHAHPEDIFIYLRRRPPLTE
jgi:hypothetical protein